MKFYNVINVNTTIFVFLLYSHLQNPKIKKNLNKIKINNFQNQKMFQKKFQLNRWSGFQLNRWPGF